MTDSKPIQPRGVDTRWSLPGLVMASAFAVYNLTRIRVSPHHGTYARRSIEWIIAAIFFLWKLLFASKENSRRTLVITPQGLRMGTMLYRWNNIQEFGMERDNVRFPFHLRDQSKVYWIYKHTAGEEPTDIYIIASDYGMKAQALATRLNSAMRMHSGREIDIHQGPRLDSQKVLSGVNQVIDLAGSWMIILFFLAMVLAMMIITRHG